MNTFSIHTTTTATRSSPSKNERNTLNDHLQLFRVENRLLGDASRVEGGLVSVAGFGLKHEATVFAFPLSLQTPPYQLHF